jgi:hypothetical protein
MALLSAKLMIYSIDCIHYASRHGDCKPYDVVDNGNYPRLVSGRKLACAASVGMS